MLVHETKRFIWQLAQAATACLQVLSASVMDILQAGIHEKQEAGVAAAVSSVADQAGIISDEVSDQPSLESDAAAASSPESTPDQAASQSARSCIFEVEVVLTITGTKITPSISQFLVRLPSYPGSILYLLSTSALLIVGVTASVSLIKQLMHSLATRLLQAPYRLSLCNPQHYMVRRPRPAFAFYDCFVKCSIKACGPGSLGPKC